MITVREYAESRSKTAQNIYGLLKKHAEDFKGHKFKENNVIVLDDIAIEKLDSYLRETKIVNESVVILDDKQAQEIERLRTKVEKLQDDKEILLNDKMQLIQELANAKSQVAALQMQNTMLIEQKNEMQQEKSRGIFDRLFRKKAAAPEKNPEKDI